MKKNSLINKGMILFLIGIMLVICSSCGGKRGNTPYISSISINGIAGEVEVLEKGNISEHVIHIMLPSDTDFKRCIANIEMVPDARISMEDPCIVEDIGGSLVLNLTLQNRGLTVLSGDDSQFYSFKIDLQ